MEKREASVLYESYNAETTDGALTKELHIMNEDGVRQPHYYHRPVCVGGVSCEDVASLF